MAYVAEETAIARQDVAGNYDLEIDFSLKLGDF